jgi:hypothetical protein
MGAESLAALVEEVRKASASMAEGDAKTNARIDHLSKALDGVLVRLNRPGAMSDGANDNADIRKDAQELCILKHQLAVPKNDGGPIYTPSPNEVEEATAYRRGLQNLWCVGDAIG